MDKNLDKDFQEAFEKLSKADIKLPPDIMLKFYAYYKQATKGNNYESSNDKVELRSAFKLNAWFQLSHMSEEQAKISYINLVNKHVK